MVASEQHLYQTIIQFDKTIVFHRKHATGSIHDYIFCYCPLVGILFEILRIVCRRVMMIMSVFSVLLWLVVWRVDDEGHWRW